MKFNPSWWISNLFLYSLLGLEQNKKNFVSPVCFRCKMVHNGGYRTERLSCKQRSVVLKFVEVGSWKLEWNRHFWSKNPPSLGLFCWRIRNFSRHSLTKDTKSSSVPTKIMPLDTAICTCTKMQLSGVIMIGSITSKCIFGGKLWPNGVHFHLTRGIFLLCFAGLFQIGQCNLSC